MGRATAKQFFQARFGKNKTHSFHFKSKKLKRRRRPLPLRESRQLWRQHPDHQGFDDGSGQPSTSASSASSECSSYEVGLFCSRRKRKLLHSPTNAGIKSCDDDDNFIRRHNNSSNYNSRKMVEQKMANNEDDCERLIMTRNRTRELGASIRKRQVVGRRLVAPGVYQLLIQFG